MKIRRKAFFCSAALAVALLAGAAGAQTPASYPKAQGGSITLPAGELSFADRVVRFDEGQPRALQDAARNQNAALGRPDRPKSGDLALLQMASITLGCRGSIVLEFTDNALIDIPGPDLHVWEVGDDIEPTMLAISQDGKNWLQVGTISGSTASLDIADRTRPGDSFRFVRLTDAECRGVNHEWPGADIDAVAAVGSAERFVFEAGVLFAFDEATLSDEARRVLSRFAEQMQGRQVSRLMVEGHTDTKGSDAYNLELSRRRADAVMLFLSGQPGLLGTELTTRAAGEREPVATNDTDRGRQQNRRVEVIVIP